MSVKTIFSRLEAHDRLRAARRDPAESFGEVVVRAGWPEDTITARELPDRRRARTPRFRDEELERIEALRRRDTPPEDNWARR